MSVRKWNLLAFLLASLWTATGLIAAEHHGVVKSGGLPIPGATVTATKGDQHFVTTTDEQGAYSFPNLEDGTWTIEVEMLGFSKITREVGIAPVAPSPEWELKLLPLEAPRQQAASAPAAPSPAAPARSGAPPEGRNFPAGRRAAQNAANPAARPSLREAIGDGFQQLDVNAAADGSAAAENDGSAAGSAGGPQAAELNQSASDSLVVNGSVSSGITAPEQNDWFLFNRGGFGGPGGFGPGPNIAELGPQGGGPGGPGGGRGFRGGFGGGFPRGGFGRGGRGGRRGRGGDPNSFGNGRRNQRMQYFGNLALIFNNSALDAKPFSLTGQNTPKAAYDHFRSTGTVGGPLKIPHLLSGQNTFFFLNYQVTRSKNGSVATGLVPTEAQRAGDFSQTLNARTGQSVAITDPLTGSPFPGNALPSSLISPQAQALLNYYPLPNFAGNSRYNYQVPLAGIGDQTNLNTRINHTINAKNQVNGNFSWQHSHTTNPNLFGFADSTSSNGINTGVQWTYHFTTRLISNLRYNFSRSSVQAVPFFSNNVNVSGMAGILGNDQTPQFWGPPALQFSSGFSGLTDGNLSMNHNNTSQVGENLIWVRGKHTIFFGVDFRRLDFNQFAQQNPRGSLAFTNPLSGYDFADFLLGYPDTMSIAYGNADKYFRANWIDTFVTDDWRVNDKISLNLGLRWDYQSPVSELYNRLVNLAVGPAFATATPICGIAAPGCTPASQAGYPETLARPNYREFQPRLGLAWRPFTKHSTVVRAGYGIYYNTSVYQPLANQMAQQSPLSYSVTQPNSLANPFTLANAFLTPASAVTPQTFALDPNFQLGYLHYWQFSVQQNLPASTVLILTYNGSKGTHLVQELLPNTFPQGSATNGFPSGYVYETSNGNSSYNAAMVQLRRRFRSGFSGTLTYTFSKAIDDSQAVGGRGAASTQYAQNWLDLSAERSLSSFNRTHTVNAYLQYSTGQGTSGGALLNGWKGALAKDWTFSTTITAGTGLPLTPTFFNRVPSGTGITGTVRPDATGLSVYAAPPGFFLNSDAFAPPAPGQWGNAGRNTIIGPAMFGLNASVGRVFRLAERRSLELRVDATNALNHVTYTSWNTTYGSLQFGLPVSANGMRSMQAILRFRF